MKKFEIPEIEIMRYDVEDILTASVEQPDNPEGGLGWG